MPCSGQQVLQLSFSYMVQVKTLKYSDVWPKKQLYDLKIHLTECNRDKKSL